MSSKYTLIVDGEETALSAPGNSLKVLGKDCQVIAAASREDADKRLPRAFNLSGEQSRQIHACLDKLFLELNARCVFLSDFQGRVYSSVGCRDDAQIASVLSTLGKGLETLLKAAPASEGKADTMHVVYQEREEDDRIAINVGGYFLLALIVEHGEHSARLGKIWYYLRKYAVDLRVLIEI